MCEVDSYVIWLDFLLSVLESCNSFEERDDGVAKMTHEDLASLSYHRRGGLFILGKRLANSKSWI